MDFPSHDTELPSNLSSLHSIPSPASYQHDEVPTINDIHSANVSGFARQAQAVALLVQVEQITSSAQTASLVDLMDMDKKLRNFLTILMGQSPNGHQCGANGVIIRYVASSIPGHRGTENAFDFQVLTLGRSLVRLHQYILSHRFEGDLSDADTHNHSHAALDTLARMMVEVANDHLARFVPGQVGSLPLSCSYNMRSMMDLIQSRWGSFNSQDPPEGLQPFVALREAISKRWRPSMDH